MDAPTYDATDYTDEEIGGQAEYLALNTSLTKAQAEALLREDLKDGDSHQYEIAEEMDIGESTVSGHLSDAHEKTNDRNAFKMAAMFGGQSPITPTAYKCQGSANFADKGYIELYRNEFPDANRHAPKWAVVTVRPGTYNSGGYENEDVRLQMRWNVDYYHFHTERELVTTLDALVERKQDFDAASLVTALAAADIDIPDHLLVEGRDSVAADGGSTE